MLYGTRPLDPTIFAASRNAAGGDGVRLLGSGVEGIAD
jgi:hypothetical protein